MSEEVELALESDATLGEGPTWDVGSATLVWVDILGSAVHRFDPVAGTDEVVTVPQHVGAAKPRSNGGLVLNLRDGIGLRDRDGTLNWLLYLEREGFRGNDAAIDPAGRLWAGTMRYQREPGAEPDGWLVRVGPEGRGKVVLKDVSVSNGIGWSPDGTTMYYVDSPTRRLDVFDYDLATGEPANRRQLRSVEHPVGVPDGLCVDADGYIWVAVNGAGEIRRHTPDGQLDRTLTVPVPQVTACCFGGVGFGDLYITTARENMSADTLAAHPLSGSLFVAPGIGTGVPSPRFMG